MSPAWRSACAMSRTTRARPSIVPAETGRPTRAPVGTSSRRYAPLTASPSDVCHVPRTAGRQGADGVLLGGDRPVDDLAVSHLVDVRIHVAGDQRLAEA